MKRGTTILSAFALVLAVALPGWAQVKVLPKQTVTVAGTVETIDKSRHALNIKTADRQFDRPRRAPSAKRFDVHQVGMPCGRDALRVDRKLILSAHGCMQAAVYIADKPKRHGGHFP